MKYPIPVTHLSGFLGAGKPKCVSRNIVFHLTFQTDATASVVMPRRGSGNTVEPLR